MRVVLYMAMTMNGYIARENDETPWSKTVWRSYYEIASGFKVIILGRRTYEIMRETDELEKIGKPLVIIVTRNKLIDNKNTVVVSSPQEALSTLKKRNFAKALVGGGGILNSSFIREKLVDEVIIDIEPLIFGKGLKLFSDCDFNSRLRLIKTRKLSEDIIQIHYKVIK